MASKLMVRMPYIHSPFNGWLNTVHAFFVKQRTVFYFPVDGGLGLRQFSLLQWYRQYFPVGSAFLYFTCHVLS